MKGDEMNKQTIYKIQLFKYRRLRNFVEELIVAEFDPAKVNGFGVPLNVYDNKQYVEKYKQTQNERS